MNTYGILAFPAHHSKSPAMHNAAFQALGIDAQYMTFEISPEDLNGFLKDLREKKHISGLSVSIPHKEVVQKYTDTITLAAKKIGAVNTLFWKEGKLIGDNTDFIGVRDALRTKLQGSEKNILLLGAGGAARGAVYALQKEGAKNIFIWNRTSEKAITLANEFECTAVPSFDDLSFETIDIIINSTSVGMTPHTKNTPLPAIYWKDHHTAFDMVYSPLYTQFLQDAAKKGAACITGENMLLFQGMRQFEIFTGLKAPEEVMRRSLSL